MQQIYSFRTDITFGNETANYAINQLINQSSAFWFKSYCWSRFNLKLLAYLQKINLSRVANTCNFDTSIYILLMVSVNLYMVNIHDDISQSYTHKKSFKSVRNKLR